MTPEPKTHHLKTWPVHFEAVISGRKPFEVRKDDRDYKPGDTLVLQEWDPHYDHEPIGYTGREATYIVPYILYGPAFGVEAGYCVMALQEPKLADLTRKLAVSQEQIERLLDGFGQAEADKLLLQARVAELEEALTQRADKVLVPINYLPTQSGKNVHACVREDEQVMAPTLEEANTALQERFNERAQFLERQRQMRGRGGSRC